MIVICKQCKKPFELEIKGRGRPRKCCSKKCTTDANRQRSLNSMHKLRHVAVLPKDPDAKTRLNYILSNLARIRSEKQLSNGRS